MTVLKRSQHWNGLPKRGVESLFLMTCENRIFTYVWGGLGEAVWRHSDGWDVSGVAFSPSVSLRL